MRDSSFRPDSVAGEDDVVTSARRDFFISYTGIDTDWAVWISNELEGAGYSTLFQGRDFRAGENFVERMNAATETTEKTLAVLSPAYLQSRYGQQEYFARLADDPLGERRTLIPVIVQPCELSGLRRPILYIDLVDIDEEEARRRLLEGVSEDAPDLGEPRFPGRRSSAKAAGTTVVVGPGRAGKGGKALNDGPYPGGSSEEGIGPFGRISGVRGRELNVALTVGFLTYENPRRLSDLQLIFTAANVGERAVIITSVTLQFDGKTLVIFQPTGDVVLPGRLEDGESCNFWIDAQEVADAIRREGYSGEVALTAVFGDTVGYSYKSRARPFDVDSPG